MSLWICLAFPTLGLDALIPGWRNSIPLAATLRKGQIDTCSAQARRLGVRPGQRRGTALALAPEITLLEDDSAARSALLRRIAASLQQYTPNVAACGHDALALDVGASLSLFHGPRTLWRTLLRTTRSLIPRFTAGMAPTAQGALLLALCEPPRHRRALRLETLARLLDALPVSNLQAAAPYLGWLEGIGCTTLEQLRKLPRKGLRQRAGAELTGSLDAAYGQAPEFFPWLEAPDLFCRHIETDRIEHLHAILAAVTQLVEALCLWLQARNAATQTLELRFFHERGRGAGAPTALTVELARPCWQADEFLHLLDEHLRRMDPLPSVVGISLAIPRFDTRLQPEANLFPEFRPSHDEDQRLLDLLCARLGPDHVRRAVPAASYLPEKANRWLPATGQAGYAPHPAPIATPEARPFWLLAPIPLGSSSGRPVYKGAELHLLRGPERLASGWWTSAGHECRDYFIAQDERAIRYWIYRHIDSSGGGWFLHGLYG
ncbi:MAG: DNA polymerase Y family protein [Candidimonas sp.]|nr:MAG: DNA polymerase Y family protein [Candidimonas sp.]